MTGSLFTRLGAHEFRASELTAGPWQHGAMHGGAPSALLAHVAGSMRTLVPMSTARLTFEFARPVPIGVLQVDARILREGKKIQIIDLTLHDSIDQFVHARVLRIRVADVASPTESDAPPMPPPTEPATHIETLGGAFAETASEVRFVTGGLRIPGHGFAWQRLLVPVVEDEETITESRVVAAADFTNGVGSIFDAADVAFINPDLTVYIHRRSRGEWIGLDSQSHHAGIGSGVAQSHLYDTESRFGAAFQSLYLDPQS